MCIKELQKQIYEEGIKLFGHEWSKQDSLVFHMLMVTELAEAAEEARKNTPPIYFTGPKPEGELVELADCVLRILNYCESQGWDLEEAMTLKRAYNRQRQWNKEGKRV